MKFLSFLILLISFQVQANYVSSDECVRAYRDAAIELKEIADAFNEKYIDKYEVSARVSGISTSVTAQGIACKIVEDPSARPCVDNAKKLYDSIRSEINVRSILVGNQKNIETSLGFRAAVLYHNFKCRQYE